MKHKYDLSLINCFAIGNIEDGVGVIVGFKGDKIQIGYSWGYVEIPKKKVKIVDKYIQYRDTKTKKVILEESL